MTGLIMPTASPAVLRFAALRPGRWLRGRASQNDWTVCRRRLHAISASYGTRPLRRAGPTPALYTYRGLPVFALLSMAGSECMEQLPREYFPWN